MSNRHRTKIQLNLPHEDNDYKALLYTEIWLVMSRVEWMKGISHIWFWGWELSPSLPGDRYQSLAHKIDNRAEISGNIV